MKRWLGIGLLLALLAALSYGAYTLRRASAPATCDACRRPLHRRARTIALSGDRRVIFCCPACALSAHRQTGRPLRLLELTDYETGEALAPEGAWLVRGSDVNLCAHRRLLLDETMHAAPEQFDRCAPGLLAFASRAAAERFIARHGGRLMPASELLRRLD